MTVLQPEEIHVPIAALEQCEEVAVPLECLTQPAGVVQAQIVPPAKLERDVEPVRDLPEARAGLVDGPPEPVEPTESGAVRVRNPLGHPGVSFLKSNEVSINIAR